MLSLGEFLCLELACMSTLKRSESLKLKTFVFRDKVKVTDELIRSKTVSRDGVSVKQG